VRLLHPAVALEPPIAPEPTAADLPTMTDPADSTFDVPREHERIARAMRHAAPAPGAPGTQVPAEVLQSYCDALTSLAPRIVIAWIWFGDPAERVVVPQIVAGRCADYARALRIERNWLTARGPVFRAIEGQRSEIFGISRWSPFGPWRKVAREQGVRSVIALRLSSTTDARRGLLVLYSDTENYFNFLGAGVFRSMAELFGLVLSNEKRSEHA
jgi:hypothetical protein